MNKELISHRVGTNQTVNILLLPELWFHDIFRKEGSVYKQSEVDLIKKLISEKKINKRTILKIQGQTISPVF